LSALRARSLSAIPEVRAGDDLAASIVAAAGAERLHGGQVVAIAHKVVSKAEGAVVALADVSPSSRARELAAAQGKDPRAVQVVLDQSSEIVRVGGGVLICRTHHGFVCANAGVDASNAADRDTLIVLPADPDASARRLRARLRELLRDDREQPRVPAVETRRADAAEVVVDAPAVLISDSFGRAWRHGQCDVAIGCAGLAPLEDWRGRTDSVGLELRATWLAVADAIAALADLARAKDSREPVVLVEGLQRFVTAADGPGASALLRPPAEDLFR
jgi:coenzyme F420-0:L-glutamate ligase/coenzyme F420-1:gamma-L-glutamate ligase